ncbi:ATP-dependent protease [Corynebacterium pseudotuberculosis]|uniref:YifB family Mg chelatase-like AAA ATPase n=1 Tax=Corynebacterium pseudotuberculosis TaxID=1719 RepID=UPI00025044C6|nr:YifB family Mg chelatase-like AAA ATPase [Corynebacterium pseudotuberculosis]AKS13653.1 ATP-dependent protease [Corynebacterium pseudotuberculosis]AMN73533.2 ATPase [Corynebacterium pseudotuberculosis]APQ56492.1 ATP-dependent protease [Corynebacterium pseudotuberculosis]
MTATSNHVPMHIQRRKHFSIGKEGERIAAQWYQARGYEVVDCNAQFTVGELDLVLESPDGCLVFVEVKTRSTPFYGLGEAITAKNSEKCVKRHTCGYKIKDGSIFVLMRLLSVSPGILLRKLPVMRGLIAVLVRTFSAAISGVTGYVVAVEVNIGPGLPGTYVVGLADAAIAESRDRMKTAAQNSGLAWPKTKVIVSLSPASLKKSGSQIDLAMCMGILCAADKDILASQRLQSTMLLGEVALNGEIRPVSGVLPALIAARDQGIKTAVIPVGNAEETKAITSISDIKVMVAPNISAVLEWLRGADNLQKVGEISTRIEGDTRSIVKEKDLSDVVGQPEAKRAAEIAAAGGHNLFMIGPPGSGKSMIAERIPTILPQLNAEELLEAMAVHSVVGKPFRALVAQAPFVAPHHSVSRAALLGGGAGNMRPGAVSLAHTGVLFLDEVSEIPARILDCLRTPMEEGCVRLIRAHQETRFPARFQLVLAANPCRCAADDPAQCRCTSTVRRNYLNNLSGPLRDRIDIIVRTRSKGPLLSDGCEEPSSAVAQRVLAARERARFRWQKAGYSAQTNADMNPHVLRREFPADSAGMALLAAYLSDGTISHRGADRALKMAWTLSDLEGTAIPDLGHVAQALELRDVKTIEALA